jgi:hypothetical protein
MRPASPPDLPIVRSPLDHASGATPLEESISMSIRSLFSSVRLRAALMGLTVLAMALAGSANSYWN